ncbi:cyclic peptide export ABC transporter [Acidisphaera sp. S103]|uniref:cyclic peptide export ABC transporter n=1 Tax=Acidisphaera sp. S103 TaxID=1747223 RepID=UPI00131C7463|nr:cyclic peptide export ABC transporter [Acidisphaera sp. S103]
MTDPAEARRPVSRLWQLIGPELRARPRPLLLLSAIAGLANAAILGVLGTVGRGGASHPLGQLALLLGAVAVYAVGQIRVAKVTEREVEGILSRLRLNLLDRVARTDLATFERFGRARLVSVLAGDVQTISAAAVPVVSGAQAALQLLFAVIYLFLLSTTAFALGTLGVTLAAFAYLRRLRLMGAALAEAGKQDQETLEGLEDALRGSAQLKQNAAMSIALRAHVDGMSARAAGTRRLAQEGIGGMTLFGQMMFFLLLGAMIWILPRYGLGGPTVAKATMVLLFVLGAIGNLLQGVTTVAFAEAAADRLLTLQHQLSLLPVEPEPHAEPEAEPPPPEFESLALRGVTFRHQAADGSPGFGIGPIDFELSRGQVMFLSGGNGAGKSTLIKVLAGLYPPMAGVVALNGRTLAPGDIALREMMAVVFSDFHLSPRLWGVPPEDMARARDLIASVDLEGIVTVRDGGFSTTALSTGQRKRLALVVALLERRPVLVLDEFAADQDPEFRRRFYREILPALRAEGLTILAVTHDDDYFDAADRRLVMDEGQLREVTPSLSDQVGNG